MRRPDTNGSAIRGTVTSAATVLLGVVLFAALVGTPAPGSGADALSADEERGKIIYTSGKSTSNRIITADVQRTEAPAPASILPCINCHGVDGRGISDLSPDINWEALTDPAGHQHLQRRHEAFDEASLSRAIAGGVDPAGNSLEATMPRYVMAHEDMADLIAYLKRIHAELDPGLSPTQIRIGTVLPTKGPLADAGKAMKAIIEAYFREVNAAGGVHGRNLQLVVGEYGADNTPAYWQAQDLVSTEALFALIASYLPGYEVEFSTLISERQIPLIGPYNLLTNGHGGRYEFYVQATLAEQAHALVEAAVAQGERPRMAVVYPLVQGFDSLADAIRQRAEDRGLDPMFAVPYSPNAFDAASVAAKLSAGDIDAVVFLGPASELVELARAAENRSWQPDLLAPAFLAERGVFELPTAFDGRVYLAYASLPSDHTQAGIDLFEGLHRDHRIDYDNSVAQIAAFAATRVLVEGLERAGPNLSRDVLITALESLQDFEPGLTSAVSYGPERRIGSLGTHVVSVDLAGRRLDAGQNWISLDRSGESAR